MFIRSTQKTYIPFNNIYPATSGFKKLIKKLIFSTDSVLIDESYEIRGNIKW